MSHASSRLSVLHGKFAAYLAWSQPFIHHLITGLERYTDGVVICNRTENLDRFPPPRIQRIDRSYLVVPSRAAVVANRLRLDFHPDVMHAHFGWSGLRMLVLKQMLRIPLVTTFGGRDVAVQMHLPAFEDAYRVLIAASDQIVCVSHDLASQLRSTGVPAERVAVVHRGTNLEVFHFVDRSDRPSDAEVRILMVGRLVEKKGHVYAIEAVRELVQRGVPVRLTIVGEGEEYARMRRLRSEKGLADRVAILPPTDHAGVRKHLAEADIFLHCSVTGSDGDTEGIPNVVVEAAATGLPVVGTRHGGIVEPVRHGETGLLVKERDAGELAAALETLARDRVRRLELGRAGRRFMASVFDTEKQVQAYREIYTRLVEDFRNKPELRAASWIPERFDLELERAMRPSGHAVEFSVSELFEELTAPADFERLAMPHEPGRLARLYELKRHVPHQIKFPLKYAIRELMVPLLRFRSRMEGIDIVDPRQDIDAVVMRFLHDGGDLESLLGDYRFSSMPRARAFLSQQLGRLGRQNAAPVEGPMKRAFERAGSGLPSRVRSPLATALGPAYREVQRRRQARHRERKRRWRACRHSPEDACRVYFDRNGWGPRSLLGYKPDIIRTATELGALSWPRKIAADVCGKRVLDVGCGDGLHGVGFAVMGARRYVGVEPRLDLHRSEFKNRNRPGCHEEAGMTPSDISRRMRRLRFVRGTLGEVSLPRDFDLVVMHNVTEHVMDLEDTLRAAWEHLRPGGLLVYNHHNFYCWNGHHAQPKSVSEIDPTDPEQRRFLDWAHLTIDREKEAYFRTRVNRIRLDDVRELTEKLFEIETWDEREIDEARGKGRLTPEIRARYPQYPVRELTTQGVFCRARKPTAPHAAS